MTIASEVVTLVLTLLGKILALSVLTFPLVIVLRVGSSPSSTITRCLIRILRVSLAMPVLMGSSSTSVLALPPIVRVGCSMARSLILNYRRRTFAAILGAWLSLEDFLVLHVV